MKRAKKVHIKPRNSLAMDPVLRKGGAHQRVDKRAARALLKARQRREAKDQLES